MHPDLSQERIEWLESQVILTFLNDGQFYSSSQRFVNEDNFEGFRCAMRDAQQRVLGSETKNRLGINDRGYVCSRLWLDRQGSLEAVKRACEQCGLAKTYLRSAEYVDYQGSIPKPIDVAKHMRKVEINQEYGRIYDPKLAASVTEIAGSNLDQAIGYAINNLNTKDEPTMNSTTANTTSAAIPFETKHYVYGRLLETMQQNELINAIKQIEAEIADLKAVKTKSTTIAGKVKELEEMLGKVVDALDGKK